MQLLKHAITQLFCFQVFRTIFAAEDDSAWVRQRPSLRNFITLRDFTEEDIVDFQSIKPEVLRILKSAIVNRIKKDRAQNTKRGFVASSRQIFPGPQKISPDTRSFESFMREDYSKPGTETRLVNKQKNNEGLISLPNTPKSHKAPKTNKVLLNKSYPYILKSTVLSNPTPDQPTLIIQDLREKSISKPFTREMLDKISSNQKKREKFELSKDFPAISSNSKPKKVISQQYLMAIHPNNRYLSSQQDNNFDTIREYPRRQTGEAESFINLKRNVVFPPEKMASHSRRSKDFLRSHRISTNGHKQENPETLILMNPSRTFHNYEQNMVFRPEVVEIQHHNRDDSMHLKSIPDNNIDGILKYSEPRIESSETSLNPETRVGFQSIMPIRPSSDSDEYVKPLQDINIDREENYLEPNVNAFDALKNPDQNVLYQPSAMITDSRSENGILKSQQGNNVFKNRANLTPINPSFETFEIQSAQPKFSSPEALRLYSGDTGRNAEKFRSNINDKDVRDSENFQTSNHAKDQQKRKHSKKSTQYLNTSSAAPQNDIAVGESDSSQNRQTASLPISITSHTFSSEEITKNPTEFTTTLSDMSFESKTGQSVATNHESFTYIDKVDEELSEFESHKPESMIDNEMLGTEANGSGNSKDDPGFAQSEEYNTELHGSQIFMQGEDIVKEPTGTLNASYSEKVEPKRDLGTGKGDNTNDVIQMDIFGDISKHSGAIKHKKELSTPNLSWKTVDLVLMGFACLTAFVLITLCISFRIVRKKKRFTEIEDPDDDSNVLQLLGEAARIFAAVFWFKRKPRKKQSRSHIRDEDSKRRRHRPFPNPRNSKGTVRYEAVPSSYHEEMSGFTFHPRCPLNRNLAATRSASLETASTTRRTDSPLTRTTPCHISNRSSLFSVDDDSSVHRVRSSPVFENDWFGLSLGLKSQEIKPEGYTFAKDISHTCINSSDLPSLPTISSDTSESHTTNDNSNQSTSGKSSLK